MKITRRNVLAGTAGIAAGAESLMAMDNTRFGE